MVDRPAAQQLAHRRAQERQVLLGPKQRIAAGNASQDHIDTIAEGHLAVVEQQHYRDCRARLDDFLEPRADRLAGIGKAVGPGTRFDRGEVAVEEPRPPDRIDDVLDVHRELLPQQPLTPTLSPLAGRGRDPRSGRVRGAPPHPKRETSTAFSVMNSSSAGVPSRVFSMPRRIAGTISSGSVTRSP
jgi:hypothetical protein